MIKIALVGCAVCFFFLGIIVGKIPLFQIDNTISLSELMRIIVLIVISISVPFWLTRKIDDLRVKKDMALSELDVLLADLLKISADLEDEKYLSLNANKALLRVNSYKKDGMDSLSLLKNNLKVVRKDDSWENCVKKLTEYWEFTTGDEGLPGRLNKVTGEYDVKKVFSRRQKNISRELVRRLKRLKYEINDY